MTEIGIVVATVVLSGIIVRAAERHWRPKHRLLWGFVPLGLSPLITLAVLFIKTGPL